MVSNFTGEAIWKRLSFLAVLLLLLWLIGTSKWLDYRLHRIITAAFKRWTDLDAHDFLDLLHVGEGYRVLETNEPGAEM